MFDSDLLMTSIIAIASALLGGGLVQYLRLPQTKKRDEADIAKIVQEIYGDIIDELKAQLTEQEAQITKTEQELCTLRERVKALEAENKRLRLENAQLKKHTTGGAISR